MDKGKVPVRIRLDYFLRFYSIQTANACIVDMSKSQKSSYDAFHYPSLPFSQTHPNRLATMGVLVGMCPPLSSKVQYPVDVQAATTALNAESLKEVMSSTVENLARRRLLLKT